MARIGSRHIRKRLIAFKVNGIDRVKTHNENTYRELFRYCQLAKSPPKDFIFPDDMDNVDCEQSLRNIHSKSIAFEKRKDLKFQEFWELNQELFIEPLDEDPIVIATKEPIPEKADKDTLYLKVDLRDTKRALVEAKRIINKHKRRFVFNSKAKYQLGIPQQFIRLEKILSYRVAYVKRQKHLKKEDRKKIPSRQKVFDDLVELKLVKKIYEKERDEKGKIIRILPDRAIDQSRGLNL